MSDKRKCGTCGKLGHNARSCGRETAYKPRGKHKPKGSVSWLKKITGKLDDSMSAPLASVPTATDSPLPPIASEEDAIPESKPGDPFAGLPKLDLPNTPAPSEDAPTIEEAPSDTVKATDGKIEFSNDELVAIAENLVTDAMNASAAYCNERGFFAIGGPFSKIVGKAAGVIVKAQATKMEVDSEEGAAWILALAGGTNGVQCFRAYQAERKKEAEKKNEPRAQAAQSAPVGGVAATVTPIRPEAPAAPLYPGSGGIV